MQIEHQVAKLLGFTILKTKSLIVWVFNKGAHYSDDELRQQQQVDEDEMKRTGHSKNRMQS